MTLVCALPSPLSNSEGAPNEEEGPRGAREEGGARGPKPDSAVVCCDEGEGGKGGLLRLDSRSLPEIP